MRTSAALPIWACGFLGKEFYTRTGQNREEATKLGDLRGIFRSCFPHFAPEWLNLEAVNPNASILKNGASCEFSCPRLCWQLVTLWGQHRVWCLLAPTSGPTLRKCKTMQTNKQTNKNKCPHSKTLQAKSVWDSTGRSTWSSLSLALKLDRVPAMDVASTVPVTLSPRADHAPG